MGGLGRCLFCSPQSSHGGEGPLSGQVPTPGFHVAPAWGTWARQAQRWTLS